MEGELIVKGPGAGEKHCAACGTVKPATAFYFHSDKTTSDGWCPVCKECRKKDRQDKRNKEVAQNMADLGLKMLKGIEQGKFRAPMCDVVSGGEIILQAFGGIEGLAQKLAHDYESSGVGTAGRTKLLLGALAFIAKGMEQQQPVDLGTLSDDELKVALKKALGDDYRRVTDESEDSSSVGDSESE